MYNCTKSRTCALELQSMPDSVIVLIIIFFTLYISKSHQNTKSNENINKKKWKENIQALGMT